MTFPIIRIEGAPHQRGVEYGARARDRVARSVGCYKSLFAAYAGIGWDAARAYARRYERLLRSDYPDLVEEMEGIATGAGLAFDDVLTLNVRTEIMYGLGEVHPAECTAFAAMPSSTLDGRALVGQNWDWIAYTLDSCIVLAIVPDTGPSILTVVEAGLVAKAGLNSNGVGLATNAMASNLDRGDIGVPYHVLLRAVLGASGFDEAVNSVRRAQSASSANYLIASRDGRALDLEATPGLGHLYEIKPTNGVIVHANCFVSADGAICDVFADKEPRGILRQQALEGYLAQNTGKICIPVLQAALSSHANSPDSLCCHPVSTAAPEDQVSTLASLIVDLDDGNLFLADGHPCSVPYRRLNGETIWSSSSRGLGVLPHARG